MAVSMYSITYYNNESENEQEGQNLPAIFMPKRRDARKQKQDRHGKTGNHKYSKPTHKEVNVMKGLEIAVIIIGCGIKILEVLEEA